jgi:hypothetical protein
LKMDTPAFVAESSVPDGFIINDPRNIHRGQIQNVLRHWCQRQEKLGPESAFGFRLIMGPKKKCLFADYPPNVAASMGTPRAKAKGKGKEREIPQLDGLLPISQHDITNPRGSPLPGPISGHTEMQHDIPRPRGMFISGPSLDAAAMEDGMPTTPTRTSGHQNLQLNLGQQQVHEQQGQSGGDELARIDMTQMVMLRNLGHDGLGPVNGPNEGLPQYEVPRSWLQELERGTMTNINTDPGPIIPRPYPRPRPLKKMPAPRDITPMIDPALVDEPRVTEVRQPNVAADLAGIIALQAGSGPDSSSNINAATVLGKRSTVVRSPPRQTQTQKPQRRKVVTRDDLAYQEAQELLKGGINKRSRKKRQAGN